MEKINHNIACSVKNCAYNAVTQAYCTLNSIKVGCCCNEPHSCDNTECDSFKDRSKA